MEIAKKEVTGVKLLLGYLGLFMMLVGFIVLLPLLNLIFYPSEAHYAICFLVPGVASILVGFLLFLFIRKKDKGHLKRHQDAVLVVGVWIITILIAAMPFFMTGDYTFTQCMFEATSGFSTTGLTIVDVDSLAKIFLLYRSIMLFFGGVGLVLILTSAISDAHGMQLYTAEGHSDKLLPNLKKSAQLIFSIYACYMVLGVILYLICGMNFFDAFNHSIASFSTGGFSTHSKSIGYYNSVSIEIVAMFLMLLGGTNYVIHFQILKAKFGKAFRHCEMKSIFILLLIFVPLMSLNLMNSLAGYSGFWEAFRVSIFQFVSAITTTGFQTANSMNALPPFFLLVLIIMMLLGGGIGSTSGGIKQYRFVVLVKGAYYHFRDKISNKRLVRTHYINRYGEKEVLTQKEYADTVSFTILFIVIFLIGTFIFTAFGYSFSDSAFEIASSISGVGLTLGITGPNAHPIIHWTSMIEMFLGRLEIVVVYFALYRLGCSATRKEI